MRLVSVDLAKTLTLFVAIILAVTGQISWWLVLLFVLATTKIEIKFQV